MSDYRQDGMIIFPLAKRERLEALIDAAITACEQALRAARISGDALGEVSALDDIEAWEALRQSMQIVEDRS